jgi:putative DNA methylase
MNKKAGETPALQEPRGWHYRGYLPHFDGGETPQSVTFRLADSLPKNVVETWVQRLKCLPHAKAELELRRRIEGYLDQGSGNCWLSDPRVGSMVNNALLHFSDLGARASRPHEQNHAAKMAALPVRYYLHAWVVMPNHVHVLFTPCPGNCLSHIVHSWKSYTAKQANRILGRKGQFWEEDYFDRFIRDETHFAAVVAYIEENPVKAGLCADAAGWLFGSAHFRRRSAGVSPA